MRDSTSRAIKHVAAVFLLVTTLSLHILPPSIPDALRACMAEVAAPPAAPLYVASSGFQRLLSLQFSGSRGSKLEEENRRLLSQLGAVQSDLARARQALESVQQFRSVPARAGIFAWGAPIKGYIEGGDTDVFSRSYIVDAGSRDGVARDAPVVLGNFAVGVVSQTWLYHSRVRVLGDPASRACVKFANSRYEGVLVGSGRGTCQIRFVPGKVGKEEIRVGDLVTTSGSDGLFPPDLVVGRVSRFEPHPTQTDSDVEVELAIDLSRMENCLILKRLDAPL